MSILYDPVDIVRLSFWSYEMKHTTLKALNVHPLYIVNSYLGEVQVSIFRMQRPCYPVLIKKEETCLEVVSLTMAEEANVNRISNRYIKVTCETNNSCFVFEGVDTCELLTDDVAEKLDTLISNIKQS